MTRFTKGQKSTFICFILGIFAVPHRNVPAIGGIQPLQSQAAGLHSFVGVVVFPAPAPIPVRHAIHLPKLPPCVANDPTGAGRVWNTVCFVNKCNFGLRPIESVHCADHVQGTGGRAVVPVADICGQCVHVVKDVAGICRSASANFFECRIHHAALIERVVVTLFGDDNLVVNVVPLQIAVHVVQEDAQMFVTILAVRHNNHALC